MAITELTQMKSASARAKDYTDGLIGELASSVADVVEEVDGLKADKISEKTITIYADNWTEEGTYTGYPYECEIADSTLTAADSVILTVGLDDMDAALDAGIAPMCEAAAGWFTLFAANKPSADISARYYIIKGA